MYITTHEFCTYSNAPTTQPVSHYQYHPLLWVADRQTCGELAVHEGTTVHDGVFDHMVNQKTLQTLWKRNKHNKTTIPQHTRNNTKCLTHKHSHTHSTYTYTVYIHTYTPTTLIHTNTIHAHTQTHSQHTHPYTHTHSVSSLHVVANGTQLEHSIGRINTARTSHPQPTGLQFSGSQAKSLYHLTEIVRSALMVSLHNTITTFDHC